MPALRKCLKRLGTYILIVFILLILAVTDSFRQPADQVTVRLYIRGVHIYQVIGRPLLKGRIQCRYEPTCSDYSIEAVRRYGIRFGLFLTVNRIRSCTAKVKQGTLDPVPIIFEWKFYETTH